MNTGTNRSVLVTGGRGFVGRSVGTLLQRKGYRVVSIDCAQDTGTQYNGQSWEEVHCDISSLEQLESVFAKETIGSIIHLAAVLPTAAQRDPLRAVQVNVTGSLNVIEMARRFDVRRLVFGSSLSVYGSYAAGQIVSEHDRAAPEDVYGAAKLCVERAGQAFRDRGELEFVSFRIGRVVGAGARSVSSAWRSEIFELLDTRVSAEIRLPYAGSETVLLIHADDVARMLVVLMEAQRPEHSVYNAPCESVVVGNLKAHLEGLNSNLHVTLGDGLAFGNPRNLDASRFEREFAFEKMPIFERLREWGRKS